MKYKRGEWEESGQAVIVEEGDENTPVLFVPGTKRERVKFAKMTIEALNYKRGTPVVDADELFYAILGAVKERLSEVDVERGRLSQEIGEAVKVLLRGRGIVVRLT